MSDEIPDPVERPAAESTDASEGLLVVAYASAGNAVADCVLGERRLSA